MLVGLNGFLHPLRYGLKSRPKTSVLASAALLERRLFSTAKNTAASGYQSIGSFHSDNVEILVSLPDSRYIPPTLPFSVNTNEDNRDSNSIAEDFLIDGSTWTFLNHGAFGGALRCGHVRANQWRDFLELQPLRYFDRELLPHLTYSTRQLASFVNGDPTAIALIQNVTSGMNTVISGYCREINRKIIYFDLAYGSVKKMMQVYSKSDNLVKIDVPLPLKNASQLEDALNDTLSQIQSSGYDLKDSLLVLDHITSNTAITFPIEELGKIAKEAGMLVLVDGAHGTLSQDLNMKSLSESGITFYVSNCHKWLSTPRGVGFLYCQNAELRDSVLKQPAIVSHGIDDGYLSRFLWDGCRDYMGALSLPPVLEYWHSNAVGSPDDVRKKMKIILLEAVQTLVNIWHPNITDGKNYNDDENYYLDRKITIAPISMHSSMALVRLPDALCGNSSDPKTSSDAKFIQDYLYDNMIEAPIKCISGILYVRISCHIYNTSNEYLILGEALQTLADRSGHS